MVRALPSHGRGREFESPIAHHFQSAFHPIKSTVQRAFAFQVTQGEIDTLTHHLTTRQGGTKGAQNHRLVFSRQCLAPRHSWRVIPESHQPCGNAPLRPRTHPGGSLPVPISRCGWRRSAVRQAVAVRPCPLPSRRLPTTPRRLPRASTPVLVALWWSAAGGVAGRAWGGVDGWAMGDAARLDGED